MKYKAFSLTNFENIPQVKQKLSRIDLENINVVGRVLPFKVCNYVIDELINWDNLLEDPIFYLTFPQKEMLLEKDFNDMNSLLKAGGDSVSVKALANKIRLSLNPHPGGQLEKNVPDLEGNKLQGIQHKYDQTVLFFPSNGQTCHSYCTFCFRWAQFVGLEELKFAMKEVDYLVNYLKKNPQVTDVLFTGGDPMVMSSKNIRTYIEPLLAAEIPNLKTIRFGTKALSFWPYRFISDPDADDILRVFDEIVKRGYHLTIVSHFSHPIELKTDAVKKAIKRIQDTGAVIRTQSPIMKHINDDADIWMNMWNDQVALGCIPYYMFIPRDTGAHKYFAVTLDKAFQIYNNAYNAISGIGRTVRGPSMSTDSGKVQVLGVSMINGAKVFVLSFIQARNIELVGRPFFAEFNENAIWFNELKPAFKEQSIFFENS